MQILILSIVLLSIAIAGIAIKMFFIKGATFTKTCGRKFDPDTGKPMECSCQSNTKSDCENI